jgi:hypothetical protein
MRTRSRSVAAMAIVAAVGLAATYTVKAAPQAGQTVDPMTALWCTCRTCASSGRCTC